jgi:hypothetical protein
VGCGVISAMLSWFVYMRVEYQDVPGGFLKHNKAYIPHWIRIGLRVLIPLSAIFYVLMIVHEDLPDAVQRILMANRVIYFVVCGCLIYLSTLSGQIALVRALEQSEILLDERSI